MCHDLVDAPSGRLRPRSLDGFVDGGDAVDLVDSGRGGGRQLTPSQKSHRRAAGDRRGPGEPRRPAITMMRVNDGDDGEGDYVFDFSGSTLSARPA